MGRLAGIARRDASRAPMQLLEKADISEQTGVAEDFRGRSRRRTVTVLSARAWDQVCAELDTDLPWSTRRSNLLLEDIDLPQRVGDIIELGSVRLQVTMELDPCSRMEEQCPGLKQALTADWRGGVACSVLQGGTVSVGDEVRIVLVENGESST